MLSLETIAKTTNADSVALMVPDIDEGYSYCYDSYNMPPEWIAIRNSFDEKIPGGNAEVYKTGNPATTNFLSENLKGYHIESVMIVPVKRDGHTIAMLELVHRDVGKNFTDEDLQLAQDFAITLEHRLPERF